MLSNACILLEQVIDTFHAEFILGKHNSMFVFFFIICQHSDGAGS